MTKPYSIDDPRFRTRSVVNAHERFEDATDAARLAAVAFGQAVVKAANRDTRAAWDEAHNAEMEFQRCRATQIFALGMLAEMATIFQEESESREQDKARK